jgi:hypothetical protein
VNAGPSAAGGHPGEIVVRVIEYRVNGGELIRLPTDLTDRRPSPPGNWLPSTMSARKAGSYRQVKTFSGLREILRSADPKLVRQEIRAHLAVDHCLTRIIMRPAARVLTLHLLARRGSCAGWGRIRAVPCTGWHFHLRCQGQGLATEAAEAVLNAAAGAGIGEVLALADLDNVRSQAVAGRLGMCDEDTTDRWPGLTMRQFRKIIAVRDR